MKEKCTSFINYLIPGSCHRRPESHGPSFDKLTVVYQPSPCTERERVMGRGSWLTGLQKPLANEARGGNKAVSQDVLET